MDDSISLRNSHESFASDLGGTVDQGTPFAALATETLSIVASALHSTPAMLTRFMLVCRRTADVGARVRYASLMLSGNKGRRTLAALLSGTPTSLSYCKLIQRLWYRGWADSDMHLNSALLAEVLPLLSDLTALWLDVNPLDATHLLKRVRKQGLVREQSHPIFAIADMASGSPSSPMNLPRLGYLRITGDPVLGGLAFHRCLVSLDMAHVMDHEELANFASGADGTLLGKMLETLSLKFGRSVNLSLAFPLLGGVFPKLRNLSLEQHFLPVLNIVELVAVDPSPFPNLRVLVLNRLYSYRIPRWGSIFPYETFSQETMSRREVYELGSNGVFGRTTLVYPVSDTWSLTFGQQLELHRFVESPLTVIPQPVGLDWIAV
ncbi:hypothetical protein DFP72DRAFT_1074905 [Ephemerocybe angulata]|uniref:Uncharacterized protein n=1 Tax=Ephemerocybe angulata TaxID=980116 RepID=A0A8H6HK39_9AGAR|nr:hypothetical protein DFP72DRAFT_1074905 [Tulosesus angulatus]